MAVSRLLCKRPSVFFESFFVPVKQPVAGAVGMWESRIFLRDSQGDVESLVLAFHSSVISTALF